MGYFHLSRDAVCCKQGIMQNSKIAYNNRLAVLDYSRFYR